MAAQATTTDNEKIPKTFRGLLFTSPTAPPSIATLPTPALTASTAIVRPLRSSLATYTREIFTGGNPRGYHIPFPLVPGSAAIGRLVAVSPDAPMLFLSQQQSQSEEKKDEKKKDQLVYLSPVLRASDTSPTAILHALNSGPSPQGKTLASTPDYRNGSWGSLVKLPAANVHVLDEDVLLRKLGYTLSDLGYLLPLMIVYGGLRDVDVRPGETVLVAPATGSFGGAAVHVALALGAQVIALGRNEETLREIEEGVRRAYPQGRMEVVVTSGEMGEEEIGGLIRKAAKEVGSRDGLVDVYFDMSPPKASRSPHIKAGILALRPKGRMSLMGGAAGDVAFPYYQIMVKGLRLQGSWMFTPQQVDEVIRLVETGRLKLGEEAGIKCLGVYEMEEWEEAFRVAGDEGRAGRFALFAPNGKEAE